ncbi:putative bifunctional diguanylate cyclase/phosphodiesterase [Lichenifustis flavocetrariae]|uniref:EAL domain-containing protein n=1 Tax=Lichenifustis flavocetrariae TaxID=2949735 RepID=A0AA42CMA9_9HYPH|nr:EAL domain-containing protein [Lichenifustis flavocetrariae]MCW6512363.1 EAL domain-containing protein [Lichenifustis flavocetrariae]
MQFPGSLADLQALVDVIPNPVVVKDRANRIVLLNKPACEFLGRSSEILLSNRDEDLFPADQVKGFHEADDRVFQSGVMDEREEQVTNGLGATRHVITRKQLVVLNGVSHLVAVVSDVTAYREAEAHSRYLASHDVLTGLPNRSFFKECMEQVFSTGSSRCALLYIDLDRFKEVNDSHGHPIGDELIIQFAQRLTGVVRASDTVARLGGDEFSIVLTNLVEGSSIETVCQRILAAASQVFILSGVHVRVTASIGVALTQHGPVEQIEMQRRADVALYQAKDDGRGCWCIYTDELDRRFKHRRSTEADLRDALADGTGIEVYYQPLVVIQSGEVIGFEALARWRHPTRGMVMPQDFIPVAEASGLITALGERVLRNACLDAAHWDPPLRLSVNVSPLQFVQGDLVGVIERALEDSGLDATRLELEITEGVLIDDANGTLALLKRIQALGVKVVLDDFGTGFSSLGYLRHFPFDKVKIDRSFITDMIGSCEAIAIVKAVIFLGKSLGMEIVAEGVETSGQFDLLLDLGCTQAQGYLISRPMPIQHFKGPILRDEGTRHPFLAG